jgi:hypothetical protein
MEENRMSKYDPLCKWLRADSRKMIPATFRQIEKILGFKLPGTARERPQWWANESKNASRHVQCKAWVNAGYHTANLNLHRETIDFILGL